MNDRAIQLAAKLMEAVHAEEDPAVRVAALRMALSLAEDEIDPVSSHRAAEIVKAAESEPE